MDDPRSASPRPADDPNLLAEQALLLILRGDRNGALPLLERAVRSGAGDLAVLMELARTYRMQGRPAEAVRVLEPAVAGGDVDPAARRELARAHLEAQDYRTALAESTALIEATDLSAAQPHELPELMDLYEIAAEAARGTGQSIRAAVLYDALYGVLMRNGRRDLATQMRQVERRRSAEFAHRQVAQAADKVEVGVPELEERLRLSRAYRQSGQVVAALDASYDALAADNNDLRPYLEIAESYLAGARSEAATELLQSLNEVVQLRDGSPEEATLQRLLGRVTGDRGRREAAVDLLLAEGRAGEAAAELWDLAGEAGERGETARATALLHRLLDVEPERTEAVVTLAEHLFRLGATEGAVETVEAALDRPSGWTRAVPVWAELVHRLPDVAEVRRRYGDLLARRGRPAEGVREITWAADLRAHQGGDAAVPDYLRVAELYDEMGDVPAALRSYDRVLRMAPSNSQAQERFVGFCLRRGRPDLGGRTLHMLAEHLLADGKQTDAIAALTQIMVLLRDDAWAYDQLAGVLERQGRRPEAMMVYRQLAARRPHDLLVRDRLRELGDTGGAGSHGAAPEG